MTPLQFIDAIEAIKRRLNSAVVQSFVENGPWPNDEKEKFADFRDELNRFIAARHNAALAQIADDLARLEPEFNAASEELSRAVQRLETLARVVTTLSTLLGIAARIAAKIAMA